MTIRSLPGGVSEPDELFGREHLIQCVWELLAGNNIYLVVPRGADSLPSAVYRLLFHPPTTYRLPLSASRTLIPSFDIAYVLWCGTHAPNAT